LFVWERGLLLDGWSSCVMALGDDGVQWGATPTIMGFEPSLPSQVQLLRQQIPFQIPNQTIPFSEIKTVAPLSPSAVGRPNANDLQSLFGFVVVMQKEGRQFAYCFSTPNELWRDWWFLFLS